MVRGSLSILICSQLTFFFLSEGGFLKKMMVMQLRQQKMEYYRWLFASDKFF